jgi:N-methylhydantoinase A
MGFQIGVDTGGTFTDLVAIDSETGEIRVGKVASTPAAPWRAVVDVLGSCGCEPSAIDVLTVGTTVGTNALLQRRGARVFYVTTRGFEDVPFIQRIQRQYLYDLQWRKPDPFVDAVDCLGLDERVDASGVVVVALESETLDELAEAIQQRLHEERGDSAVAVNLLCSYANSGHEEQVGRFLGERFPDLPVSLSHRVSRTWREYERGTTTCVDAFLKPIVGEFAAETADALKRVRIDTPLKLLKSNAGRVDARAAGERPLDLMFSGLAGGMIAAREYARRLGLRDVVSLDMGGTSADVGLVRGGEVGYGSEYEIEYGLNVATPVVDLKTIGAGGSSIAHRDRGGRLAVGPASAGASPGPACYGKGGTAPTVTDANVMLGRLDPDYFLGGGLRLDPELARESIARLAVELQMDPEDAALAVLEIACENMANAIRMVTVERGLDVRGFALLAFGGAGPLHAFAVASSLGVETVVVPPRPGLTSALGALLAPPRVDRRWTRAFRSDSLDVQAVSDAFSTLERQVADELAAEGVEHPEMLRTVSLRYAGQNFEQDVPLNPGPVTDASLADLLEAFHVRHQALYGYAMRGSVIELVHFNLTGRGSERQLPPMRLAANARSERVRPVRFRKGWVDCRVVPREVLDEGDQLSGPAIIEERDSTTIVPAGALARVAASGILILEGA